MFVDPVFDLAFQSQQLSNLSHVLSIDKSASSRIVAILQLCTLSGNIVANALPPRIYLSHGVVNLGILFLASVGLICESFTS